MGRKKSAQGAQQGNNTVGYAKGGRGRWIGALAALLVVIGLGWAFYPKNPQAADMVVYKSPSCGCCGGWIEYMEKNGFTVAVENVEDVYPIKRNLGVPEEAASCHTVKIGGYVVEGHVPVEDIRRLLKEKPAIDGIAAPGMPTGSPGMEVPGEPAEPYDVVTFSKVRMGRVFARH